MKTKFLIDHRYKVLGGILFVSAFVLGVLQFFGGFEPNWLDWKVPALFYSEWTLGQQDSSWKLVTMIENNVADEICLSLLLIGALLLAFSREKDEDELIMKIRLESMLWAARVNGVIVLLSVILVYDVVFFYVMIFNLFLLFVLFILRFNLVLFKFRREAE